MGQRRAELGGNGWWEESSWFGGQRVRDRPGVACEAAPTKGLCYALRWLHADVCSGS
jgi:hypothetical protein